MQEALQWCAVLSRGGRCGRSRYIDLVSKRLSRTESQELTRAKLIESATRLYLENGYVATSTDQVAEAAGFSRGALYSNFRSKEDLALAVLDAHTEEQFQEIAAVAADLPPERFTRFETWLTKSMGDRRWALFKSEVALSARANPELRQQLAARDQLARQALSVLLGRVEAESGNPLPAAPETLARAILALAKGIAIEGLVDDEVSPDWIIDLVKKGLPQ
ncbi:Putative transcriptional regulator, TetR family [Mycobacteroides abscessus subsp. massiliense]|uniref:Putative transcriptional regulator, TetR family n=1 Tax=Mycobacteroides abscessus TaxID=36809 RepID=A0A0U0ZMT4_9MYCO|nr:Putative transcriptional regulator%2C TetR family [Mycobacteroides abscessus]SKG51129.1 TetR family transcriptional regulator [Mycobacteroides abscessus subsp. massiliense]SKS27562.1 TetR family transcriptional regulator [Mycobacteroides abscessus subsp. abscessus]CPV57109.1 Putative transcriptional regulator%2C TetR family [Mycobacteroides abscessus]CPW92697.1 Putative transcriptional regulator%2C TetR family [Mycobacteroides abscessus]